MPALIELRNLTKDYGSFRALDQVNLTVGDGVTGLLGPNGAGKSTLIKVLLGLVRITSGEGFVLGHDIRKEAAAIRAKVGYMPEDDCYMHGLSGIESVQVAARLSCLPATEGLRRGHEILDFCGMGQERYRNVETFSTGMRQKLRFAMSIVHDPELLILDEPTSGLDPEEREAMLNRIQVLARKFGKAVILCTHILPDVKVVCDRVTILAAGQVRLAAKLEDVLKSPNPEVTLQVADGADRVAAELKRHRNSCEVISDTELRVAGDVSEIAESVWTASRDANVAVQNLIPSQSSLEEVFLNAVREKRAIGEQLSADT
ncbi:ABC transporter ATP-binding protein [Fuerstiella marisgermanici]|uniref:Daunorubicin/doxorubicin resistance ATP-binding protein DrrA n=1 Tax=Fuerstiella marisgermanici TaxID=1891926 RepID=A0A1P8WGI7_9PLAN|nr:ABC transporter ATP-binding protein [Fuerstiella marisgermanici]APZ93189.1 Daunorubicin/doxorubicin resistance ATP-binding protein DrrA [Fuerstiella marisgermanici]